MAGFDSGEYGPGKIITKGDTAIITGASIDLDSCEIFYTATYNDEDKLGETTLFNENSGKW